MKLEVTFALVSAKTAKNLSEAGAPRLAHKTSKTTSSLLPPSDHSTFDSSQAAKMVLSTSDSKAAHSSVLMSSAGKSYQKPEEGPWLYLHCTYCLAKIQKNPPLTFSGRLTPVCDSPSSPQSKNQSKSALQKLTDTSQRTEQGPRPVPHSRLC